LESAGTRRHVAGAAIANPAVADTWTPAAH